MSIIFETITTTERYRPLVERIQSTIHQSIDIKFFAYMIDYYTRDWVEFRLTIREAQKVILELWEYRERIKAFVDMAKLVENI